MSRRDKGERGRRNRAHPVAAFHDRLATRRALANQVISLANLLRRPVLDPGGVRVGRVSDVVVRWDSGVANPRVVGILVAVGRGFALVNARDVSIEQARVRLRFPQLVAETPLRHQDDVALSRDVLDHQLIDVTGVQVVRAADIYLLRTDDGWELGGIDVGLRSLARRVLPLRRQCPPPVRAIDWADLQAFVPRYSDPARPPQSGPAAAAGTVGSSVQFSAPAAELHKLRAKEVAALLADLGRRQQAQLAALTPSDTVVEALRSLDPAQVDALLAELDDEDRARLVAALAKESGP